MPDSKYCYANSDVLINKLGITDGSELFQAEKQLTFIRLTELQNMPIEGDFNFEHLKSIHKYIFQDLYEWAGEVRTVEIGKGNLFCTTPCIDSFAESVFGRYLESCKEAKNSKKKFVKVFADNYGDLNALHPFREGNGRTQREFARLVCRECGFVFDLSVTTHKEMLEASIQSFDHGDNSGLEKIFMQAVTSIEEAANKVDEKNLGILTADDLKIPYDNELYYDYYSYEEHEKISEHNQKYLERIDEINSR